MDAREEVRALEGDGSPKAVPKWKALLELAIPATRPQLGGPPETSHRFHQLDNTILLFLYIFRKEIEACSRWRHPARGQSRGNLDAISVQSPAISRDRAGGAGCKVQMCLRS